MDANANVNTHVSASDPWSPRSLKWYSRFQLACLLLVYGMHARHVWLCAQQNLHTHPVCANFEVFGPYNISMCIMFLFVLAVMYTIHRFRPGLWPVATEDVRGPEAKRASM